MNSFSRGLKTVALGLCFLWSGSFARATVLYDVAATFSETSNPAPPWTYGWSPTLGGTFSAFTLNGALPSDTQGHPLNEWYVNGPWTGPLAMHNGNGTPQTLGADAVFDIGAYVVAPGTPQYVVTRFVAPASGTFQLDTLFEGIQIAGTTSDAHVLLNGVSLFAGSVNGFVGRSFVQTPRFGTSPEVSFSAILSLVAGDVLDFAVGDGGNGYYSDGTQLSARLSTLPVPELDPSAVSGGLALVAGTVGLLERRRRRA